MSGMLVQCLLAVSIVTAPGDARDDRPDTAILFTDQQRADTMGVAGTPGVRTPTMDALAREGVRFTHAFCATPQCSPARAALLTGRYPHRTGVMGNVPASKVPAGQSPPLDPAIPGLGKVFAAAGYETAYFGKWHLGGNPGRHGFAVHEGARLQGADVASRTVNFIDSRVKGVDKRRPLLLMASWINPHDIYHIRRAEKRAFPIDPNARVPASVDDDLPTKPFPQRHYLAEDQGKPFRECSHEQWRRYVSFYNHLTQKVDAEIGEVIGALRRRNPQTLIVFTSDHGDLGGAHGLPFKGPAMYEELIRIPLIVSWPGKLEPLVTNALVSHIDILPTLCDLAGIDAPEGMDGMSMRPILSSDPRRRPVWRDAVFAEYYGKQNWRVPIRMVRTGTWKYVRYARYGEELYHLTADPHELTNLATTAEHRTTRQRLADRLDRWMEQTGDPFPKLTVTDRKGREQLHVERPATLNARQR